jgi:hypothetical protein
MRKKPKPQNRKLKISPASATAARKLALSKCPAFYIAEFLGLILFNADFCTQFFVFE